MDRGADFIPPDHLFNCLEGGGGALRVESNAFIRVVCLGRPIPVHDGLSDPQWQQLKTCFVTVVQWILEGFVDTIVYGQI
jgi:hypothetical protein